MKPTNKMLFNDFKGMRNHCVCKGLRLLMLPVLLLVFMSCDGVFDIHPYDVNFKGDIAINAKQIGVIENRFANQDTLRVAFISDTHGWYSDTRDEIAHLNNRHDVDLVIHCGDLTDAGTASEYERARDLLQRLQVPYVALVGNHDFLGTGDQSYRVMFGDMDFSFIAGRIKFVCLNTNATEYDYMAAVPNFEYMETEFTRESARFDRTVVVMHAPPYSDQFNNNVCKAFRRYLDYFPGLMCCVYGHNHHAEQSYIYGDGLMFYGVDCAMNRSYRLFTFTPDGYDEELVDY